MYFNYPKNINNIPNLVPLEGVGGGITRKYNSSKEEINASPAKHEDPSLRLHISTKETRLALLIQDDKTKKELVILRRLGQS
jgi:hypothetical protein